MWMGSHLEYKGLKEVLSELANQRRKTQPKELTTEEVGNEWKRLAAFMSGKK